MLTKVRSTSVGVLIFILTPQSSKNNFLLIMSEIFVHVCSSEVGDEGHTLRVDFFTLFSKYIKISLSNLDGLMFVLFLS